MSFVFVSDEVFHLFAGLADKSFGFGLEVSGDVLQLFSMSVFVFSGCGLVLAAELFELAPRAFGKRVGFFSGGVFGALEAFLRLFSQASELFAKSGGSVLTRFSAGGTAFGELLAGFFLELRELCPGVLGAFFHAFGGIAGGFADL